MSAYYNDNEPYAAQWLRNLIAAGLIPGGEVDERSIADVQGDDLVGFTHCHFFAGIGGWALAARLAGWPDDRPLWTGSCPCQPFSVAGQGKGTADARHLWPEFYRLIRECRPTVVFGEQVAGKAGLGWLDGVFVDLEGSGYACGAAVVPACGVGAPHRRERLWFVADSQIVLCDGRGNHAGSYRQDALQLAQPRDGSGARPLVDSASERRGEGRAEHGVRGGRAAAAGAGGASGVVGHPDSPRPQEPAGERGDARAEQPTAVGAGGGGFWSDAEWLTGADGKSRRVGPGLRLLAHGIPARVAKLRALGNAIVPQVAAEVIRAYMDCRP